MKFEGITPAAVVYTAALAECRWAGQAKHVEYVKKEMEDGGMTIVSGEVANLQIPLRRSAYDCREKASIAKTGRGVELSD